MHKKTVLILISIIAVHCLSMAQGDLMITPIRVVFDGNKQKEELNIVNIGTDTAIYSISFVHFNMNEDGSFTAVEKSDSGNWFASPFLRVFPRKVILAPGEPQVVRLQCIHANEMHTGEYRSHLYFRAEKNNKPLGSENSLKDSTILGVQLIPVFGLSIPVIIRSGIVNVNASLSNLALVTKQNKLQYLNLTINRSGNMSVYGNIIIDYIPDQGNQCEVGKVNGVGVYTNINKRNISILLTPPPGLSLTHGKLQIIYRSYEENKKSVIYAEGGLNLNE
jgi:hypothetical protein